MPARNEQTPPNSRWIPALTVLICAGAALFWSFMPSDGPRKPADDRVESPSAARYQYRDGDNLVELANAALLNHRASDVDLLNLGRQAFTKGRIELAERCHRRAVEASPTNSQNTLWLGRLLFCTGRHHAARKTWEPLLRSGGIDLLTLPLLGNDELTFQSETTEIQSGMASAPDNTTLLANAYLLLARRDMEQAGELLRDLLKHGPLTDQLIFLWGEYLSQTGKNAELKQWLDNPQSEPRMQTPDNLLVASKFARDRGDYSRAFRLATEAFQLDPVHHAATAQLAELFSVGNRPTASADFRKRAELIKTYERICRIIHRSDELPTQKELLSAISVCGELHLYREAVAWATVAKAIEPEKDWPEMQIRQWSQGISTNDSRVSAIPQLQKWFTNADTLFAGIDVPPSAMPRNQSPSASIRFQDDATAAGIEFVYQNGSAATEGTRFFEFIGGGVGVMDVDIDGYPDILFTQGGDSPSLGEPESRATETEPPSDQLFRNLRGATFANCTVASGLVDSGYSQGCACDDINNDGFPDLYVANIGANKLWISNGDGTFSASDFVNPPRWTTSCAIADISGDGIPDIYDVNHITAAGVHEAMCTKDEATYPCDIAKMKPEQDRFWLGDGFGGFEDKTAESGFMEPDGIGLGIAIADFDGTGQLSVFVANDARPNFFFVCPNDDHIFRNEAAVRGLALSAEGAAQACMGIAIGDIDSDGRQDLFVTNFFADHNTLYQQDVPGFFTDATAPRGLLTASHHLLGFGAQFLDADRDGLLDIVLTNGDVADFSKVNPRRPWQQRSQVFRNLGDSFAEVPSSQAGDYFARPVLGRGLARLDWNVDGRTDFVVSHIGSPAALVTNQSQTSQGYLQLKLIGTRRSRSAIGATITLRIGDQTKVKTLSSGGGYQAQNELVIAFSVPAEDTVEVTVDWPSGNQTNSKATKADKTLLIVEDGPFLTQPH